MLVRGNRFRSTALDPTVKTSKPRTSHPQFYEPHGFGYSQIYKPTCNLIYLQLNESYMGDCQNYGPFWGPYYNTGPNTGPNLGDPKRDHNFDNPPHLVKGLPGDPRV